MIDWTASMQQTYEFYIVDRATWRDKARLSTVKTCSITRDSGLETLGSASLSVIDSPGEVYVRVYLVATQNGFTDRIPLGTFLTQTPSTSFDGLVKDINLDAYTSLIELKEDSPPIGFYIAKESDVMEKTYMLAKDAIRDIDEKRVIKPPIPSTKLTNDFVSDISDTWLSFLSDLLTAAYDVIYYKVEPQSHGYVRTIEMFDSVSEYEKVGESKTIDQCAVYKGKAIKNGETFENAYFCVIEKTTRYKFDVDEMGRITFVPNTEIASMMPVWTYTDDNSSILYPEFTVNHDLFGIPNVVEVVYSDNGQYFEATVTNDDPGSPTSTVTRGRRVVHRTVNPELYGTPTQERIDKLAKQLLTELSSVEYTVSYRHGYCPVRVGDCVRLDYAKAGLRDVKAKVISQNISCEPGCPVDEKAVFTMKLWG